MFTFWVGPECKKRVLFNKRFVRHLLIASTTLIVATDVQAQIGRSWNTTDGNWSSALNWLPNGTPGSLDGAFIGSSAIAENATVTLDQNDTVAAVTITDGMAIETNGNRLTVNGDTALSGRNVFPSFPFSTTFSSGIRVEPGGFPFDYRTDNLTASDGAVISMADGVLQVDEQMTIDDTALLSGAGTVLLGGNGTVMTNSGTIRARENGLAINVSANAEVDLDGNGTGTLNLTSGVFGPASGVLSVNGGTLADSFSGEIFIGHDSILNMNLSTPWSMDSSSELSFSNAWPSLMTPAELDGADVTLSGQVSATGFSGVDAAHGRINANATFTSTSLVSVNDGSRLDLNSETNVEGGVFTTAENGTLHFGGLTTLRGGTFNTFSTSAADGLIRFNGPTTYRGDVVINGVARQDGNATVSSSSDVTAGLFDMDGEVGSTSWDVNSILVVNVGQIDTLNNRFDGTINVSGGFASQLSLNISDSSIPEWSMNGTMNLSGSTIGFVNKLSGSPVNFTGNLNVTNRVGIAADATFASSSIVDIDGATSLMRMSGRTSMQVGATVLGSGDLENSAEGVMSLQTGVSSGQVGLINRGELLLGNTAGAVAVDRFDQLAGGAYFASVGKNSNGTDSGVLSVSAGAAELAGNLVPRVIQLSGTNESFTAGDTFVILTAVGGVNGTFENLLVSLQGGLTYSWDVTYNPSNVVLEFLSVDGLLGDYDYDGDVDGFDFLKWQLTNGSTTNLMADGNLDGTVNEIDLAIWEANYALTAPPSSQLTVPEPSSFLLLLVATLGFRLRPVIR
jgi:hypothetical protein